MFLLLHVLNFASMPLGFVKHCIFMLCCCLASRGPQSSNFLVSLTNHALEVPLNVGHFMLILI